MKNAVCLFISLLAMIYVKKVTADGLVVLEETPLNDIDIEEELGTHREGKQRRRQNKVKEPCTVTSEETGLKSYGTCIGRNKCVNTGGTPNGPCTPRGNVCCMTEKTCSSSTSQNNTIFVNPGHPERDTGIGACTLTIERFNDNICQMKFDFLQLELSQPDDIGDCKDDFLTVTGGAYSSLSICGFNSGQTMYVDLNPDRGVVRLTVDRTAASMGNRQWKVRISQIECTSKFKAPDGCLQFYTETSGTLSSFNFAQTFSKDETGVVRRSRQLTGMSYSICIKQAPGYCGITYSRNTTGGDFGFTVSSNVDGLQRSLVGDPASSSFSDSCTTDYIVIPGGVTDTGRQTDRICGAGFPNFISTNFAPFIVHVKSNADEAGDALNRGFRIDYRQTICKSPLRKK